MSEQPRLRMIAGPNGSGKTTIKLGLHRPDSWFGIYINPDDLEQSIRATGILTLTPFGLATDTDELQAYFRSSLLLQDRGLTGIADVGLGEVQHGRVLNVGHTVSEQGKVLVAGVPFAPGTEVKVTISAQRVTVHASMDWAASGLVPLEPRFLTRTAHHSAFRGHRRARPAGAMFGIAETTLRSDEPGGVA